MGGEWLRKRQGVVDGRQGAGACMIRFVGGAYRGTSLVRNSSPLGSYSRTMSRALWRCLGEGVASYERGKLVPDAIHVQQPPAQVNCLDWWA